MPRSQLAEQRPLTETAQVRSGLCTARPSGRSGGVSWVSVTPGTGAQLRGSGVWV